MNVVVVSVFVLCGRCISGSLEKCRGQLYKALKRNVLALTIKV